MSQFKTSIPVDVAAVIGQLPARAHVIGAQLNPERTAVELVWGCDDLKSGYTFPVEYPVEKLRARETPAVVRGTEGTQTTQTPAQPQRPAIPARRKRT